MLWQTAFTIVDLPDPLRPCTEISGTTNPFLWPIRYETSCSISFWRPISVSDIESESSAALFANNESCLLAFLIAVLIFSLNSSIFPLETHVSIPEICACSNMAIV